MLTRYLYSAIAAAILFATGSLDAAAQHHTEQRDMSILQLVEAAQTGADHEAIAKRLEKDAIQFDEQAAEHELLAKRYGRGPARTKGNAASLGNHCGRLAKNLKASAQDSRALAELHREIAHQLEK
jgi:hypothetical protein